MTTEPPEEATGRRAPRRGIARAATLLIGLTAVSQVLGFVRAGTEQVVAVPAPGFDAGPRPTLALVRARMPRAALAGRLPRPAERPEVAPED